MAVLPPLALVYHGVARVPMRDDPHGLFTSPDLLRRHIDRLRRWGYDLVTFGELAERAASGRAGGAAALTFDDGFADNLHELVPVLDQHDVPATVFVVAGRLGEAHPDHRGARFLDADELRTLSGRVEIGSHGATHVDLTALAPDALEEELVASRRALEGIVEQAVDLLAYPFGRVDARVAAAAREAGYRAAGGTSGRGSWEDPMQLPRQDMTNGNTQFTLRLKRSNRYEPLMRFRVVRAARRARRRVAAALS
ncbi:MAG TPA: polysaccharide deacetylase family protein [Acidimicrobiales bacterium]